MDNRIVIIQVIVLFLVMATGVVARRVRILSDEVNKGMAELLLNVTLPFMIIISFQLEFSRDMLKNAFIMFIISMLIHGGTVFLGKGLFFRFSVDKKRVLRFCVVFSNAAFMGFPVLDSVFGRIAVFYGSIYVVAFNLFLWSYGTILFTRNNDTKSKNAGVDKGMIKKAVLNPGNFAVVIGVVLFYYSISLPEPIYRTLDMVGSTTTPLSMLIVGARLADTRVKDSLGDTGIYFVSFVRLILIPVIVYFILYFINIDPVVAGVSIMVTAMPAAANTAIFAEKYDSNPRFASSCVFMTTVLSVITIPLIMILL